MFKSILPLAISLAASVLFASNALSEKILSGTLRTKDDVVIVFDFRGHGMSGGKYTWSAKEDIDVGAVSEG